MEVLASSPVTKSRAPFKPLIIVIASGSLALAGCLHHRYPATPPSASCTVQPSEVLAGEPITATVAAANFDPTHPLAYSWSGNGGIVTGKDTAAIIDTTNATSGNYVLSAHVKDPKSKINNEASCSANYTIKPLPPKSPPMASCSADPSVVYNGAPSIITCSCISPDGVPVSVSNWASTSGSVSGDASTAKLNTAGVPSGTVTVTATCSDSRGISEQASTQVIVEIAASPNPSPPMSEPPPTSERPLILGTGREFLLPADKERAGYGLYSYLLWPYPPPEKDRERFIAVITAFLTITTAAVQEGSEMVPSSSGHLAPPADIIPRKNLNIAYIPVREFVPASPTADWILTNYGTERAIKLLRRLPRRFGSGPYIISTRVPLSSAISSNTPYLFQDLSAPVLSPELASAWIRKFQDQAASQDFSRPDRVTGFVLALRANVAEIAEIYPEASVATKSIATWIQWVSPSKK